MSDFLLLESGDFLLLESGGRFLLESSEPLPSGGVLFESLGITVIFEVSESEPFAATQVWHDFSAYLHGTAPIHTSRGRSHQREEVRAGTLTCRLDATSGDLDPRNAASPHAGCLKPRRQCRLRIVHQDSIYPVFRGFTNGFPRDYNRPNIQGLIDFAATDGFRVMGNADPTTGLFTVEHPIWGAVGVGRIAGDTAADQLSGSLIEALLDSIAWPTDLRDIDEGRVTVSGEGLAAKGLAAMRSAAEAEGGELYIDAEGRLRFRDRLARYTESRSTTSQATFYPRPQSPLAPTYGGPFRIEQDDTRIVNDARYSGISGIPQIARDENSIDEYGINDDSRTLIATDDADVYGLALLTVTENAEPADRFEQLVVKGHGTNRDEALPAILGRDLFDLVALEVESTYGDPTETIEAVIQGIDLTIGKASLVGSFRLGHFHAHDFFTIEHPTLGAVESVGAIAP